MATVQTFSCGQKPVYLIVSRGGCKTCKIQIIYASIVGEVLVQRASFWVATILVTDDFNKFK